MIENDNKKKGVLYLRVSTLHQDYEMQRKQLVELFKSKGIEIVKIYEEKHTGTDDERPQFQELLKLTKEDADYIGVWALDRLSRKLSTIIRTVELFNERKICILTIKDNFQSLNNEFKVTDSTVIMLGVLSSVAQIERNNLIERTREGRKNKIMEGKLPYTPKPPMGYKVENRQVVIDAEKAQIIKNIYRDYLSGWGMTALAKAYNIYISDIKKILHNETYIGRARTKLLEGVIFAVPQIIDEETFIKVQDTIKARRTKSGRKGRHNPLSRKVRCGHCGHHITNYTDPKNGYIYYRCNRPCQQINIQENTIKDLIQSVMRRFIKEYKKGSKDKKITMQKIRALHKNISVVKKMLKNDMDKESELREKIEILKTAMPLDKLKEELATLKKIQASIAEHKKEISRLKGDVEYHLKILSTLDDDIELDENKLIEEHITDMVLYRLKENRYKYFRIVIDGLHKYEGVTHSNNRNKVIHRIDGDDFLFYVDGTRTVCFRSTNMPYDYMELLDNDDEEDE